MEQRGNQVSSAMFVIGLGVLFLTGWWWPGILFVAGAASAAQAISEGRRWYAAQGAVWAFGMGLVFAFGFNLPLFFILIGVSMLLGYNMRGGRRQSRDDDEDDRYDSAADALKRKRDDGDIVMMDVPDDDQKRKNDY